jgi:hypothetical protein
MPDSGKRASDDTEQPCDIRQNKTLSRSFLSYCTPDFRMADCKASDALPMPALQPIVFGTLENTLTVFCGRSQNEHRTLRKHGCAAGECLPCG